MHTADACHGTGVTLAFLCFGRHRIYKLSRQQRGGCAQVSAEGLQRRETATGIRARKGGEPIVCLTAYTAPMAHWLDPHVDLLMVGDSLGMVLYGFDSTLPVTLDMMIAHGGAVVRGSSRAFVVVDMPFGSYQESPAQAFRSAARVMAETGCGGVKLEGGVEMAETVAFLTSRGIPVMGHVGLTPQSVNAFGGFRVQGRTAEAAEHLLRDAHAVEAAGAFSIVLEAVPRELAATITHELRIPTIGIGAGPDCDGQVLVYHDVVGLTPGATPRFARRYAELGEEVKHAVREYCDDVHSGKFPSDAESFHLPSELRAPGKVVR